jgi:hypothetical protein
MFYDRADNCCRLVRSILDGGPDGGACPPDPSATCRGFTGVCSDLPDQFASLPVLPDYPNGLQDFVCHAFPDDASQLDSLIVAAIAVAVGLPVAAFLAGCFEVANDSECPESWLEWNGWRKIVLGHNANRKWHYTRFKPPSHYVKWYCRSAETPTPELMVHTWLSLRAFLTRTDTPWVIEAREAEEAATASAAKAADEDGLEAAPGSKASGSAASTSSSLRSAKELRNYKCVVMSTGLLGVLITWAIFTCACQCACGWMLAAQAASVLCTRMLAVLTCVACAGFIFVYGMEIYSLLGESAEQSFARSWGVSYGVQVSTSAVPPPSCRAILLCLPWRATLQSAADARVIRYRLRASGRIL